jgi:hypothetical protein
MPNSSAGEAAVAGGCLEGADGGQGRQARHRLPIRWFYALPLRIGLNGAKVEGKFNIET